MPNSRREPGWFARFRILNISRKSMTTGKHSGDRGVTCLAVLTLGTMILSLGGCGAVIPAIGGEHFLYRNPDYGFSITLPRGWQRDELLSAGLTEGVRREQKDAIGVAFSDPRQAEPGRFFLAIEFLAPDLRGQTEAWRSERLREVRREVEGHPGDHLYKSSEVTISGHPGIQFVVCTAADGPQGCQFSRHITELFTPQALIKISFNIFSGTHPQYAKLIEGVLATGRVESVPRPLPTPQCVKRDVEVVEDQWDPGATLGGKTDVKWKVVLRNLTPYRCSVTVGYQLLDESNHLIFEDQDPVPQSIEPRESNTFETLTSGRIKTELIPKVASSRVVIVKIE
ncbi:MAG: hypothetical protein HY207_11680 [Nitrospirae bacterium]|nr:hypothetical protein [Nitrospirota bacterium]